MFRRARPRSVLSAVVAVLGLAIGQAASGAPAVAGPPDDPYGSIWNVLPPGSRGNVTVADLPGVLSGGGTTAVDGKGAPTNFADQLEMYDHLNQLTPSSITRANVDSDFKRENFVPGVVKSTEKPRSGVTIERDQFGVPYITGTTYEDTMYGAGYAAIEDRMFLMDVLRHTGAGRMAEFVGDSPSALEMDKGQLRTAYYTPSEAAAQVDKVATRYGAEGTRLAKGVDAYIDGINAAQKALCPGDLIVAPTCPAEYAALQKLPKDWTRADVIYVASLVGGIFGKGGGAEVKNATYLKLLTKKFGSKVAVGVYQDLRQKIDKGAPTTGSADLAYGGGRSLDYTKPGVALPDLSGPKAPGTAQVVQKSSLTAPPSSLPSLPQFLLDQLKAIILSITKAGMSNALLVTAKESTTGHPLVVFGPQTGYFTPQLLVEQVLKGPGVYARGVSFAGTNVVVQLGRGKDYAWSATSASNDLVDTVAERLCNTDGSAPTVNSTAYKVGSTCKPMQHNEHVENTFPNATAPGAPTTYKFDVWRTRHGIVQERRTVGGKPVAIVTQRSTYGHEVDSVVGFARLNNPDYVHDASSFMKAANAIDFTFNWFYVDSNDIAFFTSSLLPVRASGVAFDFPRWGDSAYDWKGYVPFSGHAHQINPSSGYLVSWNNRQTKSWSAPDDIWAWGPVHRSLALSTRISSAIAGTKKVDTPHMVGVMMSAATQDTRARYLLPYLLHVIGNDPSLADAIYILNKWYEAGAPRVDRDRDGAYSYQAAIALFDTWYEHGNSSVVKDIMRGKLGSLVDDVPQILDDHPRQGTGSAWLDAPWYSWGVKELRTQLGMSNSTPFQYHYCGNATTSCRSVLRASLAKAVATATSEQGVSNVKSLKYDKSMDDIRSQTAGVVGVRPIDWQNRPTFQQVVEFRKHR